MKLASESLLIVTLYRPPGSNVKLFVKEYECLLSWLLKLKQKVILRCDYNLDLLRSSVHKQMDIFIDLNLEKGFFPCIMKPTRITKMSATLIDNIFVSSCIYDLCSALIVINDISDHLPCKLLIKNLYPLKNKAVTREIRKVTQK